MRKHIFAIILILFASKAFSHTSHYEGLKKIEMDVVRNERLLVTVIISLKIVKKK